MTHAPGIHIPDPTADPLVGVCGGDGAFGSPQLATCPLCLARRTVDAGGGCRIPPAGWWCSREAGHDGPCAARPR